MLYGKVAVAASGTRPWWGTFVLGGQGAGDVTASWKGWLCIERAQMKSFPVETSAEEALESRQVRQKVVDGLEWAATSEWGGFHFDNDDG